MGSIKRGPAIEASSAWIAMALEAMRERGMDQEQLAKVIGVNPSIISKFFRRPKDGGLHVSRHANTIADALGIPHPNLLIFSKWDQEWYALGARLRKMDMDLYHEIRAQIYAVVDAAEKSRDAKHAILRAIEQIKKI